MFAGLVADRKSSASTDMTRPMGSLPYRSAPPPQPRPRQTRTSARRLLALGGYMMQNPVPVATWWLHDPEK